MIIVPPSIVLIADDNPNNIHLLMTAIDDEHHVIVAKDGVKAIEIAKEHKPDLILLDVMMPKIDGYQVCQNLKNDDNTKNIPIIFVTAMDDIEDEEKGLLLGAVDYIKKPFSIPITKARIALHLRLKRKTDMLEDLLRIDGLTEIYNRRCFDETLAKEWGRAYRSQRFISIMLLDIDYFKSFNDHYGHAKGDVCLVKVAKQIRHCLKRPSDFVGRYGGEEFAIIAPETPLDGACRLAESIRFSIEGLSIPHAYSSAGPYVTISIGIVSGIPEATQEPLCFVRQADEALYEAKNTGRNKFSCWPICTSHILKQ